LHRKFALIVAVAFVGTAFADSGQTSWIATPNRAYAAMPATSLADGRIGQVSWSPDGEHLLVAERPVTTSRDELLRFEGRPPSLGSLQLLGWERRFHQVKTLWSTDDATATIDNVAWLRGTSVALVTVRWVVRDGPQGAQHPLYGVLDLDAASGKYRWIPGIEQLVARPFISPSPTRPIAAATFSDNPETSETLNYWLDAENAIVRAMDKLVFEVTLDQATDEVRASRLVERAFWDGQTARRADNFWTLDAAGSITHAVRLEKSIQLPLVWNADGSAWYLVDTDPKTKKRILAHLTDQGNLIPTAEQAFVPKEITGDLEVAAISGETKHRKSQVGYQSLWLHSRTAIEHGEILLSVDGEWPELSPTGGGVFYIDGGVAKVRELIPLSADQQRAAREAPKTAELITGETRIHLSFVSGGASRPPQP